MNRRGFFSLMAGAAGAALVPWRGIVDPIIALAPPGGWFDGLQMREVNQYLINTDSMAIRHDVAWISPAGEYQQHFVNHDPGIWLADPNSELRIHIRELSRERLREIVRRHRPAGSKTVQLNLPQGIAQAAYV